MHKRMSPHGDYDHIGETINLVDNLKYSKIYRTDIAGSVMFKINKDNLKIEICDIIQIWS